MPQHRWTPEEAKVYASQGQAALVAKRLAFTHSSPQSRFRDPPDTFIRKRLARVRRQVELVDQAIEGELRKPDADGQRVDRLAAASMRLSDQEFALAGRSKPGNTRPGIAKPVRRSQEQSGPLDIAGPACGAQATANSVPAAAPSAPAPQAQNPSVNTGDSSAPIKT